MIDQHLYMIVPSEYATKIQVNLPMLLDSTHLMEFGWDVSTVHVCRIGQTNGKTAMHLYFQNSVKHPDWAELMEALQFNTDSLNPFEDIEALESALCLKAGVMICLDIEHLKERDPDFAIVNTSQDEDGNTVESPVLIDKKFAV